MATIKTISKAEQIRIKQATSFIDYNLRNKLTQFENDYLEHFGKWEIEKLQNEIKNLQSKNEEIAEKKERHWETNIKNNEFRIQKIEEKLKLDTLIKFQAYNLAKDNYDKKVNNIVNLLVKEGFSHLHFRIEQISKCGAELEFLISNNVKEVHARLIFVNGEIQSPHFRFITTVRAK